MNWQVVKELNTSVMKKTNPGRESMMSRVYQMFCSQT